VVAPAARAGLNNRPTPELKNVCEWDAIPLAHVRQFDVLGVSHLLRDQGAERDEHEEQENLLHVQPPLTTTGRP
jgi:hypothetical protein